MQVNRFKMMLAVMAGMFTGAAIYYPFVDSRWATAAGIFAICVGYTLVVFGLVWSVDEWDYVAEKPRPARTIFLVHCLCVAWVAEIVNFGLYIKPSLPAWLGSSLGTTRTGKPAATGFELLQMAAIVTIFVVEFFWLLRNMPKTRKSAESTSD